MGKIDEMIQKIENFEEIPYYTKHFQRLIEVLLEKYNRRPQDDLPVAKRAELQVVLEGMCYYYQAVVVEKKVDDIKRLCHKLIESTNRAIYALWNEIENTQKSFCIYSKYLPAYREYLQSVCNAFREEQILHHLDAPSLIFTFALELLENKVHMDSLFTQIYESELSSPMTFLCAVFVPTDESVDDIYKYLPMLTHEVSHNFKYSETKDRNCFIVKYMLDKISDHIVRRLMMQSADGKCDMFIGRAAGILTEALSDALRQELEKADPEYIEKGHLDYLPSLICSILYAVVESDEYSAEYYPKEENGYDILYKSFIGLAGRSTLSWYITTRENIGDRTDSEIIASLFMDIMNSDNYEQVKWYREVTVHNAVYACKIEEMLNLYEKNRLRFDKDLMIIATEEILLSVIDKMVEDFKEYRTNNALSDEVLINLASNAVDFQKCLDKLIQSTKIDDEQIMYEFADCCISTKNYVNSIYYLNKAQDRYIEKKAKGSDMLAGIYEALSDAVKSALSDREKKPYFAVRDTHALIIKLGLLNGKNKSELFVENYKLMISAWGKEGIYETLEDYLNVYREVFADLSMCAVFQFSQLGYLRYLTSQFSSTREMGEQFQANMALERIQIVLRTIEHEHPKDKFIEIFAGSQDNGIKWTKEWEGIIQTYISGDRQDKYDERYYEVYTNKIAPAEWVKRLRNDETIQAIGDYYNRTKEGAEETKGEVCKKFFDRYMEMAGMREIHYENHECAPIEIMLEVNQSENK